ncbi:MAG: FkbM family methyltransferase [Ignavibacterium sp.]|nr:FkbM family methyltransferase [Ignavibacterium sp.]MCX7907958.1 FkbM family methyltransferase [Ignavibacteria bacterium]MDW8374884.1 FkbM family methyltransferase [Ignavibacteriales bacterium]
MIEIKKILYKLKNLLLKYYQFLFCRKIFQPINNIIYDFALVGKGIGGSTDISKNGEGRFLKSLSFLYNEKSFIVFDIGANVGEYSSEILQLFSKCYIYAFEPNPKSFILLSKKFNHLNNVMLYNLGLGSIKTTTKLYDYKEEEGSTHASIYKSMFESFYGNKETISYEIEIITLDDFLEKENIQSVDLLKIDIEGGELEVLKGAKKSINENRIKIIQFEFNYTHICSRVFLKDFFDLLANYDLYRVILDGLCKLKYDAKDEIFMFQNIIAINKLYKDLFNKII